MRYCIVTVLCCIFFLPVLAQHPEEDAVKATIQQLFTAMKSGDTALLASTFAPNAVLQTIVEKKDGSTLVQTEEVQAFISSVGRPHTETYDERIVFGPVSVDGKLASAWTPYRFFLGEKFSHCGVNSFQLVKLATGWKIQYIIDTRRRSDCD